MSCNKNTPNVNKTFIVEGKGNPGFVEHTISDAHKAIDEGQAILEKLEHYELKNGELSKENQELKEEVKMLLAELSKYQDGGGTSEPEEPSGYPWIEVYAESLL